MDKDAIIKVVLNGAGQPSRTVLEKPLLGSKPIGPYPFDPKRARQLLKEAGAEGATIDIVSRRATTCRTPPPARPWPTISRRSA